MAVVRVLGIVGSLRRESYNRRLIEAARELAPNGITLEVCDIADVPLYNDDVYKQGFPAAVVQLRQRIKQTDALLIATPEYNYSIPGVLKNAIDWASRPPEQPFTDKPLAIIGASPGALGTARAQYHLRQAFIFLDARVLSRPELMVAQAGSKLDAQGRLTDEATRRQLTELLLALGAWTQRLKTG
ncbi:MAG: NAD(P)H-dependent oxidoreductase [Alphaproteobacteria bacterium]|nr:NAD(P)H-dependent oxidoreductase [Alphaproteobacteria bacterium]